MFDSNALAIPVMGSWETYLVSTFKDLKTWDTPVVPMALFLNILSKFPYNKHVTAAGLSVTFIPCKIFNPSSTVVSSVDASISFNDKILSSVIFSNVPLTSLSRVLSFAYFGYTETILSIVSA